MHALWRRLVRIMNEVHKITLTLWLGYRMMESIKLNRNSSRAVEGMAR